MDTHDPHPTSAATRRRRALSVRAGNIFFRFRDALFPIVMLGVAFGTRPRIAGGDARVDHLVDAAGLLIVLSGQLLRVLVIGLEYITRGGQNRQVWANTLVAGGMFAHCRNPLYVGNFLIVLGLAIVHNGWAMYAIALPFFVLAYVTIVSAEEEYLREKFGDAYVRYCERVPRWIPSLRGLAVTLRGARFDWLRVLRKEYGTPFAWLSGFLVLLIWEHMASSTPLGQMETRGIAAVWALAAVAYIIVRTAKLRGWIGSD